MFYQSLLYAVLTSTLFLLFHINGPAQSVDRSKTIKDIDTLRKQLSEKEKHFLSPSAEDFAAHAEFLKQPNTGLFRLLPERFYEVRLTIRGGGAYYSFSRLTHEPGYGYEIYLQPESMSPEARRRLFDTVHNLNQFFGDPERGPREMDYRMQSSVPNDYVATPIAYYNFKTGFAGANYGFLAVLGKVPLEKVTLDHKAVKFLLAYNPPSAINEIRAEQRRALDSGIGKHGYKYKGEVTATPGYTYVLRSINFSHSDVLIAFRFVRREKDGGVVILWKMLKKFPRPDILRPATR